MAAEQAPDRTFGSRSYRQVRALAFQRWRIETRTYWTERDRRLFYDAFDLAWQRKEGPFPQPPEPGSKPPMPERDR